jgi:hypothetical protein
MIADDEICDILMSTGDIAEGCRRLIVRANEHGGEDNITAILVRIDEGGPNKGDSTKPPPRSEGETTARGLPVVSVPAGYGTSQAERATPATPNGEGGENGRPPFQNGEN